MKPILIDKTNDVSAFASTDPTRYVLQSIHLSPNGAEATNGRIAIRVPYPATPIDEYPPIAGASDTFEPCIAPIDAVKEALAKAPKKNTLPVLENVRVATVGKNGSAKIQLSTTDLDTERTVSAKPIEGTYPDVDQVLPTAPPTLKICLSAHLLKTLAEYAAKHGTGEGKGIHFSFTDGLATVGFEIPLIDGRKAVGVLMPMRVK